VLRGGLIINETPNRERLRYGLQRVRHGLRRRLHIPRRAPWLSVGRLDYAPAAILLKVDSGPEFHRLASCAKEPWTVEWIERALGGGGVLYDIGANVGAYSLVAARASGGAARVIAFEPAYSNYAALCENIALNGAESSVMPLPVALAESTALTDLRYRDTAPGAALHSFGAVQAGERPVEAAYRQQVLAFSLDDLVRDFGLPLPTHVKLDVDGAELEVLRGARDTVAGPGVHSLLVELDAGLEEPITDLLRDLGFDKSARHNRPGAGRDVPAYGVFERA
jgi:FkbM family methyltransferase